MSRRHYSPVWLVLGIGALASAQGFRERVRVGLVTVRLDVRGHDGRPLQDLKASELKLRVDGKEIPIEGLDRVDAAASAAAPKSAQSASAPAGPQAAPPPAPPGTTGAIEVVAASSDLYLAILVDETSTNSFDRRDVHRQIENFLAGRMAPGVHVMLERFDGHLRTECPWTADASKLLAAAKKMSKRTFDSRMPSPSALADEIRNGRKPKDIELQIDLAARRSFDGINQALLQFPTEVPGRMGLVFISDGTPLMTPFDLSLMLSGTNAGARDSLSLRAQSLRAQGENDAAKQIEDQLRDEALSTLTVFGAGSDATWVRRVAAITKKALELDIAFYLVDSEAVERGTNPGASSKWPGRSMPGIQGGASLPYTGSGMTARVAVAQSMETLAETTGGQTILVSNQFSDRLGTVVTERSAGYALTFRDPTPGDFRFHRIEISVERPGAKVSYRRGYRVPSDEERTIDAVLANLNEPHGENPLQAKVSFEAVRKESGRNIVAMRLEYPRPPEAPGPGTNERDIQIWAVCSDDEGNRAKPIIRKAKAQSLSGEAAGPFADAIQLGLPPGPYIWSIALKDVPSGLTSYLVVRKVL
jgi:VWFA-related protein